MARSFKGLSALLSYPDENLLAATGEIRDAFRAEAIIDAAPGSVMDRLLASFEEDDLFAAQERYVELFDKTRRLSLHLFEHVHGESRDRGQAMVDLAALYERGGLMLSANELPDYLPLFLEYLSTRPFDEAKALLGDTVDILTALEERLDQRRSPYVAVLTALIGIAGRKTAARAVEPVAEPELSDLAALDAEWEETAVTFGPGEALDGCSIDRLRMQVRAGRRDVRQARA
ncbi:nitrate reductase molybdenum cofactor assembly chaperone [Enterovirga rhinocerotis]|uniref:Respiratory nitrate reductase chaperone NarJ n=1 Tax=Enterovirga rhinocerotis TaxID=1339210 RepID=A0A4R7BVV8_9HYPH|nr:nitrate reductase molybdenum cofactor assembly chaperone [Enterovirga rhinocerotis]TDR89990.1 respiratory nitrate reductase chaperone NarJ [Enterovirga rhinocerotis]